MREKKPNTNRGKNEDLDYYIAYSKQLENSNRALEKELEKLRHIFGVERQRLEEGLNSLSNEVDRLRDHPLVVAVIVKIDEETGNVVVLSSTGSLFVVKPSRKVKHQKLEAGMFVSLNQRTFAIMEILSITKEDIKESRNTIFPD